MKRLLLFGLAVFALVVAQHAGLAGQGKAMSASGVVKSVSASSIVVSSKGKDMTFAVDGSTKFVGKGLGTKSAAGKLTATDAVHEGDQVSVSYHDMGGAMHAAQVRITAKSTGAMKK